MKTKLFLTGLALTAIVAVSNAQTTANNSSGNENNKSNNTAFVDKNNNGTCDNYENRVKTGQRGNAYRKGRGQGNGQGLRNCRGYGQGQGQGKGQGLRNGQGRGQGQFVDANKNGVCDNRE